MAPRALMLSWEYPPVVQGGLGRHVAALSGALAAQGVEVHVLTRGPEGHDGPEGADGVGRQGAEGAGRQGADGAVGHQGDEAPAGVRVHRVAEPPFPADIGAFVAWVARMNRDLLAAGRALAGRVRFDLVHGHDWLVAEAAAGLARAARIPYLTTIHATEHGRHGGRVSAHPQSAIHALERAMALGADQVITCSQYMRRHAGEVYGLAADRVAVIPNGVAAAPPAPAGGPPALRARLAAPGEQLVLLAGRLVHEKGFQVALDALAGPHGVIRRVGGVRFAVAGSGPHERELRAQARRLGIAGHGTFLGWAGDATLASLYRSADLCVVPSLYEPFGLVALEAMAAGCPCVVAGTGGLREVAPAGVALHAPPGDVAALRRTMERALGDAALRERLAARASAHVRRFTWPAAARRTAALYGRLVAAGARPAG